jgi:beta-glucosidase
VTFPKSTADLPPFEDYRMAGRTYRYADLEPLYPFGFGLSYTHFEYSDLKVASPGFSSAGFDVSVRVSNAGEAAADEIVQLYVSALKTRLTAPHSQLIGFKRVTIKAGQKRTVRFTVTPEMLALFDEDGRQKLEAGKFRLTAGGCSPGARSQALGASLPAVLDFQLP